jgi:transcriptional regulator with XRE-family HTH domain
LGSASKTSNTSTTPGGEHQAGLHRSHVSLIERGQGMPTLAVLHKRATALGTTMAELMAEVESDAPSTREPPAIPRGRLPKRGQRDNDQPGAD